MDVSPSVVVTGAAGMLGSIVSRHFESAGWSTTRVIRPVAGGADSLNEQSEDINRHVYADLSDLSSIQCALENLEADLCIHCAAITNLNVCQSDPDLATRVHVDATRTLAQSGAFDRLIYISTDSVFDGKVGGYSESDACRPLNVYAETKWLGEEVALEHPGALVLRTNLFDVRNPPQGSLAEWGYRSLSNQETIAGYTNVFFNPLHVNQIASLLLAMSEQTSWLHQRVNVGSNQFVSKFGFLQMLAAAFDFDPNLVQPKRFAPSSQDLVQRPLNTCLNIDRLHQWLPNADLSLSTGFEAIQESVENR